MIISSISILVVFFAQGMYKTFVMSGIESNNIEDYISGKYLTFLGGKEITNYIPMYEEIGDYESLYFGYFDGHRKNNFFHNYYVSFGLRVQYTTDEYLKKKEKAGVLNKYDDYSGTTEGYKFVEDGDLNHIVYGVRYNDNSNTIEYLAVCGDDGNTIKAGSLWGLLAWNNPF
jgi:hypothetical protein